MTTARKITAVFLVLLLTLAAISTVAVVKEIRRAEEDLQEKLSVLEGEYTTSVIWPDSSYVIAKPGEVVKFAINVRYEDLYGNVVILPAEERYISVNLSNAEYASIVSGLEIKIKDDAPSENQFKVTFTYLGTESMEFNVLILGD